MKKELRGKFCLMLSFLCVMLASFTLVSCGDDDEQQNGWYVSVDTEQSSVNFNSNLYVQAAVKSELTSLNADFAKSLMTEKDAKKHFQSICSQVSSKVNSLELPVLDNTYCVLYLTHAISDPNGTYPVIASEKVTFTSKAE